MRPVRCTNGARALHESFVLSMSALSACAAVGVMVSQDVAEDERVLIRVSGAVQGVGFRWWTRSRALELGLRGWAMNRPDGRVEVVAEGPRPALNRLTALLSSESAAGIPARPGRIDTAVVTWQTARGLAEGFTER